MCRSAIELIYSLNILLQLDSYSHGSCEMGRLLFVVIGVSSMQSILYGLANECMASLFGGGEAAYSPIAAFSDYDN